MKNRAKKCLTVVAFNIYLNTVTGPDYLISFLGAKLLHSCSLYVSGPAYNLVQCKLAQQSNTMLILKLRFYQKAVT